MQIIASTIVICMGLLDMVNNQQTDCQSGHCSHQVPICDILSLLLISDPHCYEASSIHHRPLAQCISNHIYLTRVVGDLYIIISQEREPSLFSAIQVLLCEDVLQALVGSEELEGYFIQIMSPYP